MTELPEPKEQGQTLIIDGHTFVVNPYHEPGFPLAWFEVLSTTKREIVLVP